MTVDYEQTTLLDELPENILNLPVLEDYEDELETSDEEEETERVIHLLNPSLEEIKGAWKELSRLIADQVYPRQKIVVTFSEEVKVRVNQRKVSKLKRMAVRFFNDSKSGSLCYTFHSRTGYFVRDIDYTRIKSLAIFKELEDPKKQIQRILNRRHPNAWTNLTTEDSSLEYKGKQIINIKSRFPSYVIERLKEAFDEKKDYQYSMGGKKRDWHVSTRMCSDGVFRAWYSSEYSGYGHGDYYLLLSPTIASFHERD